MMRNNRIEIIVEIVMFLVSLSGVIISFYYANYFVRQPGGKVFAWILGLLCVQSIGFTISHIIKFIHILGGN